MPNAFRLKQLRSVKKRQRDRDRADGFSLNPWRHVDESKMDQGELDLLATLKNEFGQGVINGSI